MTITETPYPPLPAGADTTDVNPWETHDGCTCRLVWSHPMPLPDELATEDVRVVVSQRTDGGIVDEPEDRPLIYLGGADYSIESVRALARALTSAADLADQWTGKQPDLQELLIGARDELQRVFAAVRMLPGNADSYVIAALDSIADAQAVL